MPEHGMNVRACVLPPTPSKARAPVVWFGCVQADLDAKVALPDGGLVPAILLGNKVSQ